MRHRTVNAKVREQSPRHSGIVDPFKQRNFSNPDIKHLNHKEIYWEVDLGKNLKLGMTRKNNDGKQKPEGCLPHLWQTNATFPQKIYRNHTKQQKRDNQKMGKIYEQADKRLISWRWHC